MSFKLLKTVFAKGDLVITADGHYYIFESYDEDYNNCNVYGIELSEKRDRIEIVHAVIQAIQLVHGNNNEIDDESDLGIIRELIMEDQRLHYREATSI